jgi:short-subunit dehydrogenase
MSTSTYALVTGASAGIGAEFARQLAAGGSHLVLTARRADRLESLAAELRTRHGIDVQCLPADLADPGAPEQLFDETARRRLAVETLINNAGYGVTGAFLSKPWRTHADFIQVLMTAPAELAYLFLPAMRERGRGRIVNVASLAGMLPAPGGHTLYAASKAYLIKFSQALALESSPLGVKVCALCPGLTWSEFHDAAGTREQMNRLPKWMWMDAADVVRDALAAVERGETVHVSGRVNRAMKALFKLLPDSTAEAIFARRARNFRDAK